MQTNNHVRNIINNIVTCDYCSYQKLYNRVVAYIKSMKLTEHSKHLFIQNNKLIPKSVEYLLYLSSVTWKMVLNNGCVHYHHHHFIRSK